MENYMEPYEIKKTKETRYKEEAYLRAQKKVKKLVGFYWHAASYVVVNLFIVGILVANGVSFWSFGVWSTAAFWGIGLGFHALGIWGPNILFGKHWEERKIREFMEEDERYWK